MRRALDARSIRTLGALLVVFAVGLSYVLIGVLRINPLNRPLQVTVLMARSGGLLATSPVSYRGVPVGRVDSIGLRPGGVRVVVALDQGIRIPADTEVKVADLSAAGEQYLDFQPRSDGGPYLKDGSVIGARDTSTPTPFSTVVSDTANLVNQVDPAQLNVVAHEAAIAFNGSAPDLVRLLDGGNYLLTGLQGVLPQTVDAMHNSRVLLGTVYDLRGQLGQLAPAARDVTGRLREAGPAISSILAQAPHTLDLVDDIARNAGPPLRDTLRDADAGVGVLADRLPAISLFLPGLINLGPTVRSVVHDGRVQILIELYPRPMCDYRTPRRLPNVGGHLPPYLWGYCATAGPRLQRGAAAVPRPASDHTDRPPRGVNPLERAPREPGPPPEPRNPQPSNAQLSGRQGGGG